MSERHVDHYWEALDERMSEREWTSADKYLLRQYIAHNALLSTEGALLLLEFIDSIDDRIKAEKEHDRVFGTQHLTPKDDVRWEVC